LEGLEISEIKISKALSNKDFRTDSNFWTKIPKQNPNLSYTPIGAILKISQYGISIEMNEIDKGYPIYRMNEIHNMLCDFDVNKCADIEVDQFKLFSLNDRDVLFNRTNSYELVGRTGLYRGQPGKNFIFASYLVRFVPDEKKILPEYLVAFLSSKYGVWDIRRRARHSINQTNVNPEEIKGIPIPLLGNKLQEEIRACFDCATSNLLKAKQSTENAETTLLRALGLENWQAPEPLSYVRSSRDAFAAGRLDAEHFQEKYYTLKDKLSQQSLGYRTIGQLAANLTNGVEIRKYHTEGVPYLRVGDVENLTINGGSVVRVDPALAKRELDKVGLEVGNVLVSRSGSLAVTAVVEKEWSHSLISSHLIRVKIVDSDYDPYYVALFLRGLPGRMQIFQWSNGGVQPEISQPSLSRIVVPRVGNEIQKQIRDLVLQSRNEHQRATQLLDAAKRAVEIAIEQDEESALTYLEAYL